MKRFAKKDGFTLAELLIVVAIIAVLVAVTIPVFTTQLNKAKYATDEANARSIYAELTADYLANSKQTYSVTPSSVTKGSEASVQIKNGDVIVDTFEFNGMANINITVGTTDTAPFVVIGECDQNGNKSVAFGTVAD